MNSGLKDGMIILATQGDVLQGTHPFAVSASGTGRFIFTMSSTRLTKLVKESTGTSVVERMAFCRRTSGKTAGPSWVKAREPTARERSKQPDRKTGSAPEEVPPRSRNACWSSRASCVCAYAWHGTTCPQVYCLFTHNKGDNIAQPVTT